VFEGFGLSLVEAMAAGCVPIASRIRGVTDAIVDAGQSGYLFPVGNSAVAAGHLVGLWRDRRLFSSLSSAAREAARRFDLPALSDSYFNLLQEVARSPREVAPPMQLANWRMSPYLRPGWRSLVPGSVKGALRMFRERL
jgi:glycosyltransferase involved in cell wall biosynthesis